MNEKSLDELCMEASKRNQPLLARGSDLVELKWTEPPRPQASFGLINDWVEVGDSVKSIDIMLLIPFQPKQLGWVRQETLQLFRYDPEKKNFEKVDQALRHPKHPVVHAIVDRAGVYGLIGLHSHPLVKEAIGLFCEMRVGLLARSQKEQRAFRDEICKTILCARDFDQFWLSQEEFAKWAKNHGLEDPTSMPPPLPRLAHPGETICERCNGIDLGDFLDCQVLEPSLERPCEQVIWENVGPKHISGAMRQIVVDPTDHRRLYAVSANGGIWRLNNVDNYPDEVWRPLTDTEDVNNLRFRTMAVAPSNGRILYAANSVKELRRSPILVYSEIYRSSDRGLNWQRIHREGMGVVHRLVVHPANPDVVFAATSTGLWRRRTVGVWRSLFSDDCLDVVLDPDDSSIVYLGVRDRGLFKSFTSGSDWSAKPILIFNPAAAGTDDPTTTGIEPDRQTVKLALGRLNPDQSRQTPTARTVIARFGNEINVSHTSGDNPKDWSRVVSNVDLSKLEGGSIGRSDTLPRHIFEWVNCLAVDPFNSDHILLGSILIFESKDGGQTWPSSPSTPHEDEHSIAFDPEHRDRVYIANDGGIFLSVDGGSTWPTMSLADTSRTPSKGLNLAKGLITSEFRHSAVHGGRCVAAIDHTGYILSDNFAERWQFLFNGPDRSGRHGGFEGGFVYSCPASSDRWYIFNTRAGDDPTSIPENPATPAKERVDILGRLAQFDFTRTDNLVNPPSSPFPFLSAFRAPVTSPFVPAGNYFPEDMIYNEHICGPFAIRFSRAPEERLILFGTVDATGNLFNIQSLRLGTDGTNVTLARAETVDSTVPFTSILFVLPIDRAFAITKTGMLFERRDVSVPDGQFTFLKQWPLQPDDLFVSRLAAITRPHLRLYAISQSRVGRYDDHVQDWATVHVWPDPNERLLSIAAHPSRDDTLFLGTSRGVYLSENGGVSWLKYRQRMPAVPVTDLFFDQGFLYAATFGRGLWRCTPC